MRVNAERAKSTHVSGIILPLEGLDVLPASEQDHEVRTGILERAEVVGLMLACAKGVVDPVTRDQNASRRGAIQRTGP